MIYLDTSVALAHLLVEDRVPPERLWREDLISSRSVAGYDGQLIQRMFDRHS